MKIEIVPATLRDVSFVAANMCPEDWRELACQFQAETRHDHIAGLSLVGEGWAALVDGQPVEAFGAVPSLAGNMLTLWAFGTARRRRAIPGITRFIRGQVPQWIASGVTRCEARAIVGHPTAHRWLLGLGGEPQPCKAWGRNGEDFVLYSWTRETWAK